MLCPSCGCNVGDALRLCESCAEQAPVKVEELPVAVSLGELAGRRPSVEDILLRPSVMAFVSLVFSLFLFLCILLVHPTKHAGLSALLTVICLLAIVAICAWAKMWIELLQDDFVIAMVYLIFPIGVYSLLITYPERTMKPFTIHMVCMLLSIGLQFAYSALAGHSAISALF